MDSNVTQYKALLNQKQYLKLIAANVVSRFGDSLDSIAFSWIMYEVTGNAALIALIMAINFLPNVFLQPFLGVWAERCSKKKIMVLCDWGRAVSVSATAILFTLDMLSPLLLIFITLVNSTLESVRMPAGNAITPHILDSDKYTVGMALSQTLGRVSELIGMGLAGGIIALWGSHAALLIDAATFVFSAIMINLIKYTELLDNEKLSVKGFTKKLVDGFLYVKTNKILLYIIILGAFINFSIAPLSSFQAIYVADIIKMGPEMLSAMGIALTAGMAVGSFITPKLMTKLKGRSLLLISGVIETAAMLGFWAVPSMSGKPLVFASICFITLVLGIGIGIINVLFSAAFTANVDPSYLARISAITNALLVSISPIASLLCSFLAIFISVPSIFLLFGIFHLIIYTAAAFVKAYHKL